MLKDVISMGSHFKTAIQESAEAGRSSEPQAASSGVRCLELQLQSLKHGYRQLVQLKRGKRKNQWKDRACVMVYTPSDVQRGMKEC